MVAEAANDYYERDGWNVIPIDKDKKTPKVVDLKKIYLFPESKNDINTYFPNDDRNIAVAAGPVSGRNDNTSQGIIDFEEVFVPEYFHLVKANPILKRIVENTRVSQTWSGGRHVYIKTPVPFHTINIGDENKNRIIDVLGWKAYAVAPPSQMKNKYLWENWNDNQNGRIYHATLDELNEFLKIFNKKVNPVTDAEIDKEISKYFNKRFYYDISNNLSYKYFRYLRTGDWKYNELLTKEGKPDRSRIEYIIMYRLAALGFELETIEQFFIIYAYPGSKFKSRGIDAARYNIQKAIAEYQKRKSDFDKRCDELLSKSLFLNNLSTYESSILTSILSICKSIGRFDNIRLSQTELAKKTGITQQSVGNNIKNLIEKGMMKKVLNTDGIRASVYSINEKTINKKDCNTYTDGCYAIGITNNFNYSSSPCKNTNLLNIKLDITYSDLENKNDDIFFRQGIGKTGYKIVTLLNKNIGISFDSKSISDITGLSLPTVNKKLNELVTYGYVMTKKVPTGKRPKAVYWIYIKIN